MAALVEESVLDDVGTLVEVRGRNSSAVQVWGFAYVAGLLQLGCMTRIRPAEFAGQASIVLSWV